jgi:aerobic carbon-monoxide dehydrogenase large subunit
MLSCKLERVGFSMIDDRRQASGLEGADFSLGLRPKNIGARVKRVEDRRLLTGQGAFTGDRIVPGALHIAFCRSDHAHALISSISTSTAAAMGVIGVYTAREFNGLVEPVYATSRMADYHSTALYPLAREKVRYVGEPVVAVLAESRYRAEDALDRIEIAYEPLDTVIDPERAVFKDAPLLHEEAGTNILATREFARGDLVEAMARAAVRVGGRFRFRRKAPVALEPRACLAEYDRGRRLLTLTALRPVFWHDDVRDAHRRTGDRPGVLQDHAQPLRRRRGLRSPDQPDDRRGPGSRRRRPGHRGGPL